MSAAVLLDRLKAAGIELAVEGDRLRYRPVDAVPPDLLAELREHKPALLALLATDPLTAWLNTPAPLHVQPMPSPTVADLDGLGHRLATYLETGEDAIEAAALDHPRRAEALRHFEHLDARLVALSHLVAALRGRAYDRAGLATWCAGEAFATGDLAAVLPLVDAAGAVRSQDGPRKPQDGPQPAAAPSHASPAPAGPRRG